MLIRKLFLLAVPLLSVGFLLLMILVVGSRLIALAIGGSEFHGGIGTFAFGISWPLLKTFVIVATVLVIGFLVVLWSKFLKS